MEGRNGMGKGGEEDVYAWCAAASGQGSEQVSKERGKGDV